MTVFVKIVAAFLHAASCRSSAGAGAGLSGFSVTDSDLSQFRVFPLHRSGCFSLLARYNTSRFANISMSAPV